MVSEALLDDVFFLPRVADLWAGLVYRLLMVVTMESLVYLLSVLACRLPERVRGDGGVRGLLGASVLGLGCGGGSFFLREGDEGAAPLLVLRVCVSCGSLWLWSEEA